MSSAMPERAALARKTGQGQLAAARLVTSALAGLADALLPSSGCCLTFHRAVPASDWANQPNRGFHLDLAYLERLVRHLQRTGWDIVTIDQAVERAAQGFRRFVNFSVDDGYRDTAELVVPLFRRLGAPVTIFVTTGIPDGTLKLRDAGLETILLEQEQVVDGARFALRSAADRRAAFAALSRKWDGPHGDDAYRRFCDRHGYDSAALDAQHRLTWDMLDALRDDQLVEIGAHTVSHARIGALEPEPARAELVASRERLEAVLGRPIRHFAFPYGRRGDCGMRDFALARQAGFASAATTRKGIVTTGTDRFQLPRNTINGAHRRLPFAYAHLSGASGLASGMLGRD